MKNLHSSWIKNGNKATILSPGMTSYQYVTNAMVANYLNKLEELTAHSAIKGIGSSIIYSTMSEAQKEDYMHAIRIVLRAQGISIVTPDILFRAADKALDGKVSLAEARIGLQPGTMNPIHYGHISTSLAGIIDNNLAGVLLAIGGTVPDKPYAEDHRIRMEMTRIATRTQPLVNWLQTTPVRQQVADMFSVDNQGILFTGKNEIVRRSIIDIAAFIWLFRANPRVKWTYLVGSDKVAGYGKKNEYNLIVETLSDVRANTQFVHIERPGVHIDITNDIEPYEWMLKKWQAGFFKKSSLSSSGPTSTRVRTALAKGHEDIDGISLTQWLPQDVIAYIRGNQALLDAYAREVRETQED